MVTPRWEARRELTSALGSGALGDIEPEDVAEHIVRCYEDAPWPVLREAGRQILRRARATARAELVVHSSPPGLARLGPYRIGGPAGPAPYQTTVLSLQPVIVSCDCDDYLGESLGLCEHGLTVLQHLAGSGDAWTRAFASDWEGEDPAVWWHPIRSLQGPGDWLETVRVRADLRDDERIAGFLDDAARDGWVSVVPDRIVTPHERVGLLESIESLAAGSPAQDPALRARLRRERDDLERKQGLQLAPEQIEASVQRLRLDLYPYQRQGLERFLSSGRLLLADDMGLGKTVQATAIAHVLSDAQIVQRVLVLAPASLKGQWVAEWRRMSDVPIDLVDGPPPRRRALYRNTQRGALVANYEQVLRDLRLMQDWAPQLVVLDEGQRIKNAATQTARRVGQLDAPYRLVLTGTPIENRLEELASIMDFVDPLAIGPKWRLNPAHHRRLDGERVGSVKGLGVLRARLAPRMLRRRRSEILHELPERTDTVVPVSLTTAQWLAHRRIDPKIAQLAAVQEKRSLTHGEFIQLMSLLNTQRVIANGMAQLQFDEVWPKTESSRPDPTTLASLKMPKLELLRELVQSLVIDQGRKVVLFSQWRRALILAHWAIAELLQAAGVRAAFFTGKETPKRRTHNIVDFHDDPDLRMLLCSDAGAVGLNLQRAASCCIQFELPWNPAVFEQRVARVHRLGQSDPVDVYSLVSPGSIEERIAGHLTNKRALSEGLLDSDADIVEFLGHHAFLGGLPGVPRPEVMPEPWADEEPEEPENDEDDEDDEDDEAAEDDESTVVWGPW